MIGVAFQLPIWFDLGAVFLLALAGCVCFVALSYNYGLDVEMSAWIAIATTLLIRVLAVRFNWTTSAFGTWRKRD